MLLQTDLIVFVLIIWINSYCCYYYIAFVNNNVINIAYTCIHADGDADDNP